MTVAKDARNFMTVAAISDRLAVSAVMLAPALLVEIDWGAC
jgi:hypothetical protein